MDTVPHDVFISYNSADSLQVRQLARGLRDRERITCWLDVWSIVPGTPWQEAVEFALVNSQAVIIAVGYAGLGPWHREELRTALQLRVDSTAEQRRIITVLLPGVTTEVVDNLPPLLRRLSWVDLRSGLTSERLARIVAGIRGEQPGDNIRRTLPHPGLRLSAREASVLDTVQSAIRSVGKWAKYAQNDDGGFPSDTPGSYSCTWASAGLLWALQRTGEHPHATWMKRALTWVLDNRNPDSGTPQVVRGDPSITDATAQTLLACTGAAPLSISNQNASAVDSLVDWIVTRQQGSGGWSWRPGHEKPWTASTAFALLALRSVNSDRDDILEAIDAGINWLREARNLDHGWGSQHGGISNPALSGLAIFCLTELGHSELAAQSLHYLRASQSNSGHWSSAIDRPHGMSIIRFGDAYGVLGLASCVSLKGSTELRKGSAALLESFKGDHFQFGAAPLYTWPTRDGLLGLSAVLNSIGGSSEMRLI